MLRREEPDQFLASISCISQIQQREEALMDVTEVEELLLNCLGPKKPANMPVLGSSSSTEEKKSSSFSDRDVIPAAASLTVAVMERKGQVEKDIFKDGELEELMEACEEEEEIVASLLKSHDDSTEQNTLPHRSDEKEIQNINLEASYEDEEPQPISLSSSNYIKNWQVKVLPIPIDDHLRNILKQCDYWIVLEGNMADRSGNLIGKELITTSKWVVRVLTENCIQAVDGSVYTLLGEMDIVSTCFSDSSFDSGIFELGFGGDDHTWKERVLQIIGQDTSDTDNDIISDIVQSDLMTLYQKEVDRVSLDNKESNPEAISIIVAQDRNLNDVVHESNDVAGTIHHPQTTSRDQKTVKKTVRNEKKKNTSEASLSSNTEVLIETMKRKDSAATRSSETVAKKIGATSKSGVSGANKKKGVLKREADVIPVLTKSVKKNRRISFSDEIMGLEEAKETKTRTPSPPQNRRTSYSRSPTSALFKSLESPDVLVSRSGRMSKKPSEWWKV